MRLVEITRRAGLVKEQSGAALFGTDLSTWPVRIVDAVAVVQEETNRAKNAAERAATEANN